MKFVQILNTWKTGIFTQFYYTILLSLVKLHISSGVRHAEVVVGRTAVVHRREAPRVAQLDRLVGKKYESR